MLFLAILSIWSVGGLSMIMTLRQHHIERASILQWLRVQAIGLPFIVLLVGAQVLFNHVKT